MDGWIDASKALPPNHERVRFIITGRHQPLRGVYEGHCFHSRWGTYDETRVETWRELRASAPATRSSRTPAAGPTAADAAT